MAEKDVFQVWDWENEIYPTPKRRKEDAVETPLKRGDIVKILIGPATGKIGIVVVERNANYQDSEPYSSDESIGVKVAEESDEGAELAGMIDSLTQRPNRIKTSTRWFDDTTQLEVVQKAE